MPSVSAVIMAFNEAQNLEVVVQEIDNSLRKLGHTYELLIIDDGSTDQTPDIADALASLNTSVRVIHLVPNQGLGTVYRTGLVEAKLEYITFFPADGQFPADIIGQFMPLMERNDLILGYLQDRNDPILAKFLSWGERTAFRILLGPIPRFQGIFMLRRSVLKSVELKSTGRGAMIVMELIIRVARGGYRVLSVPTEMRPRMSGASKVTNWVTTWSVLKQIFAIRRYV